MATAPILTADGSLRFNWDADGMFRVTGHGFWSVPEIERHFRELEAALAAARAVCSRVRVLVDLREAAVQSPETAARISAATARIYAPDDRIAIVVASSLARMQMRRVVDSSLHEIFLSELDAEAWLAA